MKKVLEFSAKVTIAVMVAFILLGIGFFVYSTYPDVLGSITDFDDDAQQTAVWVGVCSAIAIGIKMAPISYNTYDENGVLVPRSK